MGLDITAYKNLKKIENPERDEYGDLENWELLEINQGLLDSTEEHFSGRTQGLAAGVYESEDSKNFRVGAYTGYNQFRDQLEKIATNTQLYELIMFSDCEGYIGSVVSKKLAQDFQDLEVIAKEKLEERDLNIFLEFKNAFELASHNGCVSFH